MAGKRNDGRVLDTYKLDKRSGTLWDAVGRSGTLWDALGRSGSWDALGRSRKPWDSLGRLDVLGLSFAASFEATLAAPEFPTDLGNMPQIWEKLGAVPAKTSKTLSSKARWRGKGFL